MCLGGWYPWAFLFSDEKGRRRSRRGRRIGEKRDERERKGRWVGDVHIPTCDWFSFSENP